MANPKTTFHRDGSVTYWSVYEQRWRKRVRHIPDAEIAASSERDRPRLARLNRDGDWRKYA